MPAILPAIKIDSDSMLARYFTLYQIAWIESEDMLHAQGKQAFALAEKSIRIGWTYADAFKNVRKRLRLKKRDYLFATKDYPSALEYMRLVLEFTDMLSFTRSIVNHGEDYMSVNRLDPDGRPTSITEQVKVGYIKYDNGSRIIAFSSSPHAMAVYGGDVGLDEFAKHPNAQLLWQTAQGRVAWAGDLAVWSSHDGEDTLFNRFAQEARAGKGPWNLYFRVTMPHAVELGLLNVINRVQDTHLIADQFIADCRSRAVTEEIYQQSYMCNPLGAATASIVEWSAIERCRFDYPIERVHLEAEDILKKFGEFSPSRERDRENQIAAFLRDTFPNLLSSRSNAPRSHAPHDPPNGRPRLGFDVAASGQGNLAAFYIDHAAANIHWLRALLTARTEDWHFLKTVLFYFLTHLKNVQAAGDESGLGRQICWEAASRFSSRFLKVNFAAKKHDLGFALMNQLSVAEKRFPRAHQDIAADYFALLKVFTGTRWTFSEGRNTSNPASHCDIAWAGALASHAHTERRCSVGARVLDDSPAEQKLSPEERLLWSDDPRIWRPWR